MLAMDKQIHIYISAITSLNGAVPVYFLGLEFI